MTDEISKLIRITFKERIEEQFNSEFAKANKAKYYKEQKQPPVEATEAGDKSNEEDPDVQVVGERSLFVCTGNNVIDYLTVLRYRNVYTL